MQTRTISANRLSSLLIRHRHSSNDNDDAMYTTVAGDAFEDGYNLYGLFVNNVDAGTFLEDELFADKLFTTYVCVRRPSITLSPELELALSEPLTDIELAELRSLLAAWADGDDELKDLALFVVMHGWGAAQTHRPLKPFGPFINEQDAEQWRETFLDRRNNPPSVVLKLQTCRDA